MSPFLKIGATFASFQSFGTWPVWSDLLKMISSIGEIWWLNSLSGDRVKLKVAQSNLKAGVRRGKEEYKNKIQAQFKQNNLKQA